MNHLGKRLGTLAFSVGLLLAEPRPAVAQDIEVPILVQEVTDEGQGPSESDDELDLANLVTSAAKGVTTVQEAPAIITIIPAEELADRQARRLTDIIDLIPGYLRLDAFYGMFPVAVVRGQAQGVLMLHDGFSLFDSAFNVATVHRVVPLETIKRIETISGPGGVLWGANSFLGVMNIITKDAEDIDGIEAGVSYGDGRGDRQAARGYVMAGIPQFLGRDDWGLVLHASYENYQGPTYNRAMHMFSTPLPNPNSVYFYGAEIDSDPSRSNIFNIDGKLQMGKLSVHWAYPIQRQFQSSGFNGPVARGSLAEDSYVDPRTGELACSPVASNDPRANLPTPPTGDPLPSADDADYCLDRGRATRNTQIDFYERYGFVEYKSRFSEASGISVKGYFIEMVRTMKPILVLMPVPSLLEGGLAFDLDSSTYRAGGSFDGDIELSDKLRLLYGFEAFHEWIPDNTTVSRQGAGVETHFRGPYNLGAIPTPCPRSATMWDSTNQVPMGIEIIDGCPLTFSFEVSRTTVGGFTSAQFRPSQKLILDGGVRLQAGPEIATIDRGFELTPTLSAAAVYEFVKDWHIKINYAEGFRPPVFQNTDSNGESVQIDGDVDLAVETSRAGQVEINARLLRNQKRIRELSLRADYAYTVIDNYIAFIGGRHANTGQRGIHSTEFLAKLYLKGGHRFELGYSFNYIDTADKGAYFTVPNHWFNLSSVNPLSSTVSLASVLRVYGAFEDPNRRVEARDLHTDPITGGAFLDQPNQIVVVDAHEQVIDRQAPAAELQVGVRWMPTESWQLQGTLYNAFNNERGSYDNSNDLEPRLEITPFKFEAFRFFVAATYSY